MAQIKQRLKKNIEIAKKLHRASGSNVPKSTEVEMKNFWLRSSTVVEALTVNSHGPWESD